MGISKSHDEDLHKKNPRGTPFGEGMRYQKIVSTCQSSECTHLPKKKIQKKTIVIGREGPAEGSN